QAGAVETGDLLVELELLDDVPCGRVESGDVAAELIGDVVLVVEELVEVQLRDVVELLLRGAPERQLHVRDALLLQLACLREYLLFGRLEHAVEPTEDNEREDDLPVLRLLVVAAQDLGERPEEVGPFAETGHFGLPLRSDSLLE